MGDIADYYRDISEEWFAEHEDDYFNGHYDENIWRDYQKGKLKWETKEGEEILVGNMTDTHILNTKKYLENKNSDNTALLEWLDVFNSEIQKRKI